ncbi:MAG TPA: cupin domain-containing protein [Gemmatimonadaceae bacterium]|nr:cupin domain-containing protein [Gemmatimonadaceae bacterium]
MRYALISAVSLSLCASTACGQQPTAVNSKQATPAHPAASAAKAAAGEDFTWGPAPAIFPAGAEMAVLQGNPGGTEMFTVRLRFPNGYRIAPHTHPTDEHVTVIHGHLKVGMGETVDAKSMMTLKPGGFVTAPAKMAHYVTAVGPTVVQVSAMGPFAMTYVNPADTPPAAKQ